MGSYKHYQDKSWLHEKYWGEGLSVRQMASWVDRSYKTILYWMEHHNIPRRTISEAQTGEKSHNWTGGIWQTTAGYIVVLQPDHPRADARGHVFEHVLVLEERLKRPLLPEEQCHHINGIKDDNRPENLTVFPSGAAHAAYHQRLKRIRAGQPSGPILR